MAGTPGDPVRAPDRPLLPEQLRTAAVVLVVLGAVVLLALAVRYRGGVRPGGLDEQIYRHLPAIRPRSPALNGLADAVPVTVAVVSVAVAAAAAARAAGPWCCWLSPPA